MLRPIPVTIIQVAHRELQFEVRDHRMVPEVPVQRFGYEANQIHGRFIKGTLEATSLHIGVLCLTQT